MEGTSLKRRQIDSCPILSIVSLLNTSTSSAPLATHQVMALDYSPLAHKHIASRILKTHSKQESIQIELVYLPLLLSSLLLFCLAGWAKGLALLPLDSYYWAATTRAEDYYYQYNYLLTLPRNRTLELTPTVATRPLGYYELHEAHLLI